MEKSKKKMQEEAQKGPMLSTTLYHCLKCEKPIYPMRDLMFKVGEERVHDRCKEK